MGWKIMKVAGLLFLGVFVAWEGVDAQMTWPGQESDAPPPFVGVPRTAAPVVSGDWLSTIMNSGWRDLVAQLLPLLLANLSPLITQWLRNVSAGIVGMVPPQFLGVLNMVVGALAAGIAASATGGVPMDLAVGGGAAVAGVSWKLKQGDPVPGIVPAKPELL